VRRRIRTPPPAEPDHDPATDRFGRILQAKPILRFMSDMTSSTASSINSEAASVGST